MPQVGLPIADVSLGSYAELNGDGDAFAYNELDEGITYGAGHDEDVTAWRADLGLFVPLSGQIQVQVDSLTDPVVNFGHVMKAAIRNPGLSATNWVLQLIGDSVSMGADSIIATHSLQISVDTAWKVFSYQLATAEADDINDYGTLQQRLTSTATQMGQQADVSAFEFLVPWSAVTGRTTSGGSTLHFDRLQSPTVGGGIRYEVEIAFDSGIFTDVTSGGFVKSLSWDRSLASVRTDFSVGEATIVLSNIDGRFSPDRRDTIYSGKVRPGKEIRISAVHEGIRYPQWRGTAVSWKVMTEIGRRETTLKGVDLVHDLAESTVDLDLKTDYNVGSLFVDVLQNVGVTSFLVDSSQDTVPLASFSDDAADDALQEMIVHGDWKAFVDGAGVFHAHNRYHPIRTPTVGSYTGGSPSQQPDYMKFTVQLDGDEIITRATVEAMPKQVSPDVGSVGFIVDPVPIFTNSAGSFEIKFVDPVDPNTKNVPCGSVTPFIVTIRTDSSNTGGDAVNSGVAATFTALAKMMVVSFQSVDSRVLYFTQLNLRGFAITEQPAVLQSADSESAIAEFGLKEFKITSDLISDVSYARDYAAYFLRENQGPLSQIDFSVKNIFPDILDQELGERLHAIESLSGIGSLYAIYGMKHKVRFSAGPEHTVNYDLRYWLDRNWKIFDDPQFGRLDQNRLAF